MSFAEKLIYVRAILKISQSELAKELGVSFQSINRWERGKSNPTKRAIATFELYCKQKNIVFENGGND